jgi:hypothetical protein
LGQFCWCASSRRPFTMSILSTWWNWFVFAFSLK